MCLHRLNSHGLSLTQHTERLTLNVIIIYYYCSFMSTLLTTVLTHHSAWIYTVSNDAPDRQEENKHKPKAVSIAAFYLQLLYVFYSLQLDLLSKTHPYNSLWAQLG